MDDGNEAPLADLGRPNTFVDFGSVEGAAFASAEHNTSERRSLALLSLLHHPSGLCETVTDKDVAQLPSQICGRKTHRSDAHRVDPCTRRQPCMAMPGVGGGPHEQQAAHLGSHPVCGSQHLDACLHPV